MLTRRVFLRGGALVMAGSGMAPGWLARAAASGETKPRKKVLVAIFQRGAADGLNIVVPFGDPRYRDLRPTIAVSEPGGDNTAIDLDGFFGLNPALKPMKELWDRKMFAIVEATGSPDPNRSHFEAQDYMESGTPGRVSADGWLNRSLVPGGAQTSPLRAVSFGSQLPRTLRGERAAIAVANGQNFGVNNAGTAALLEKMYARTADARLESTGRDAFAAMKMVQSISNAPYTAAGGANYGPGGELGRSLQQLAKFIKADAGVEAAFAEIGGWDHHGNEPGQMAGLLNQFSNAIRAFALDLGDRMEDVVLVTMSEFGRTARENGDAGTDHGHGSLMMVVGGSVNGGRVYGKWPGLESEQLFEGRDLAVTTDFREVLSELVTAQMGSVDLGKVFPGYRPAQGLGLMRA